LLCLAANTQASDLVFADALVTEATAAQMVQEPGEHHYSEQRASERDLNPYGLYLSVSRHESLEDNGSRQTLGLEWELFENGWYEKKKQLTRQQMQTTISELQRERDLTRHNEAALGAYLNSVTVTVKHFYAEKLLSLLEPLVVKRKRQMDNGFATQTDLKDMELKLRKARLQQRQTQQARPAKLSTEYARLGNDIGSTTLKPSSEICNRLEKLPSVRIYDAFADLSEKEHSYWDDVGVSVFMEYRDIERQDAQLGDGDVILEGYVAGIDLQFPFFTASSAQKESRARSAHHRYNKIDTMRSLENSCQDAIRAFNFSQEQVLVLEAEHENLLLRRKAAQRKAEADLPGNEENYEREVELLDYLILLKEENIILGRIQALANLLKIRRYHPSGELSALSTGP